MIYPALVAIITITIQQKLGALYDKSHYFRQNLPEHDGGCSLCYGSISGRQDFYFVAAK